MIFIVICDASYFTGVFSSLWAYPSAHSCDVRACKDKTLNICYFFYLIWCVICFHTGYKRMKIGRLARLTKGDKVNRMFVSWGVVSLIVSKRIQGIWSIFVRDFLESIGWKDVRSGSSIWGDNHSRTLCLIHVDRPYIRLTKGVKVNHMFVSWGVVSLIVWKNKPTY